MRVVPWEEVVEETCELLRRRLEARDATSMGMLAEVLVAVLLPGATVMAGTYGQGWDVCWESRRIQVKASGRTPPAWKMRGKTRGMADIYVFADHSTAGGLEGWRWWVAPTATVIGRDAWSPRTLSAIGIRQVGCEELADAIAACPDAWPEGEIGQLPEVPNGGGRNLNDDDLDSVVRELLGKGFTNVNQICRELRGTPNGTNTNRAKASLARVNAERATVSAGRENGLT